MIETKVAWISLLEKDVLRVEYKPDAFVDLEEFEENLRAYKKLMTTEKVYLLTVANPGAESSLAVRNQFASPERSAFKIAEAFVVSSLAQKLVANFVMKVQRPTHLLKFFNDEVSARAWLFRQRELNMRKAAD
jgi:hypothetical protein